jgi:hypothetical protein
LKGKTWEISEEGDQFIFKVSLEGIDPGQYVLDENKVPLEATVFLGEEIQKFTYEISQELTGKYLVVKVKKLLVESYDPAYVGVSNCTDMGDFGVVKRGATLFVSSVERGMACFGYESRLLAHWNGYLIKVDSTNIKGKELFFYIFGNRSRKQSKIESDLKGGEEYFVLNPGYYYDDGYYFSFQNPSFRSLESENELKLLEIYLLPFDHLKNIRLIRKDLADRVSTNRLINLFTGSKTNYYTYLVEHTENDKLDLILYQTYDPGWKAYIVKKDDALSSHLPFFRGKEIKSHFYVNNWANGWELPKLEKGESVVIFFWPQLLEYIGITTLMVVWFIVLLGAVRKLRILKKEPFIDSQNPSSADL